MIRLLEARDDLLTGVALSNTQRALGSQRRHER